MVPSPCNQMSQVETKDALLHAINEEYVEAVEVLLDHEESLHCEGEPWSWETLSEQEVVDARVCLGSVLITWCLLRV